MLDQQDIKQIGTLLEGTEKKLKEFVKENNKELVKEVIVQVGEMIEQQVLPQITSLDAKVTSLDAKVTSLEGKIVNLPDKDYLDDKLADLKGDIVVKVRRENEKVDFIVGLLRDRGIFTDEDVRRIKQEFQIFPSLSV